MTIMTLSTDREYLIAQKKKKTECMKQMHGDRQNLDQN